MFGFDNQNMNESRGNCLKIVITLIHRYLKSLKTLIDMRMRFLQYFV